MLASAESSGGSSGVWVMADIEVVTEEERDRLVYEARFKGESLRSICKQFGLSIAEVNAAIDRTMLRVDNGFRAREHAISVDQVIRSKSEAVTMVLDKNEQATVRLAAMHAQAKLDLRLGQLLGTDAPMKVDPIALIEAGKPAKTSTDRIEEVIERLVAEGPSPTSRDADPAERAKSN
jgi:hypothetical protein